MPRTILVLPPGADPGDYLGQAAAVGASEFAVGIPPRLASILASVELPAVHVEPDPTPVPEAVDPVRELTTRVEAQQRVLDLLLLGGLDDAGTIDGAIGDDLPDLGGSLDDLDGLDGLDWEPLPDSGETLDDLEGLS